ncbi:DNA/RNA non-specific endonuclease [Sorangium sp. So ce1078]|uniref:DNA/RNA non-specific endonuclease n=1 Tax=Sorangium sp. So ce1078 TaxID=3133329 RepID=UPI003F618DCE
MRVRHPPGKATQINNVSAHRRGRLHSTAREKKKKKNWGDTENPSNDDDGGHLNGSQLGGWGRRANLVPQDASFSRANWVALENKMALCGSLPPGARATSLARITRIAALLSQTT